MWIVKMDLLRREIDHSSKLQTLWCLFCPMSLADTRFLYYQVCRRQAKSWRTIQFTLGSDRDLRVFWPILAPYSCIWIMRHWQPLLPSWIEDWRQDHKRWLPLAHRPPRYCNWPYHLILSLSPRWWWNSFACFSIVGAEAGLMQQENLQSLTSQSLELDLTDLMDP